MNKKCVIDSEEWFADRKSIEQWLGTDNQLSEAVEILMDMFNGDYPVETFRNDVLSYFEPDDRDDINR